MCNGSPRVAALEPRSRVELESPAYQAGTRTVVLSGQFVESTGIGPVAGCLQSIPPPQRAPHSWTCGESNSEFSRARGVFSH